MGVRPDDGRVGRERRAGIAELDHLDGGRHLALDVVAAGQQPGQRQQPGRRQGHAAHDSPSIKGTNMTSSCSVWPLLV